MPFTPIKIKVPTPKRAFKSSKTTIYSGITDIKSQWVAVATLSNNIRYCFGYCFGIKSNLQ